MSLYLLVVSYAAMVVSGLLIGALFQLLGLTPAHFRVTVFQSHPEWNLTTCLDLASVAVAAVLGWRFLRTGGREMLRMMNDPAEHHEHHDHHAHHHHHAH